MAPFDSSVRYDRQVRLWGEEGQASIGSTSVCMLGSDSLGSEILKSLVLAGIRSFFIVDDAKVEQTDIGQNFFLDIDDIGKYRAQATLDKLLELNRSVIGNCSFASPHSLAPSDVVNLTEFSVVVSSNLPECTESAFAQTLYNLGVPFICAKTYGLVGTIKICIKEHTIANSHEENPKPDLRLDIPFEKLKEMAEETNLDGMSNEQFRHTPYILILFKALDAWRAKREDVHAFPNSYSERKEILSIINDMRRITETGNKDTENFDEAKAAVIRAFQKTEIGSSVQTILNDPSCRTSSEPFWLICEALRRFVNENNGTLPVRGTLPDMTSDTARYTRLATMFHEKAICDANRVLEFTRDVEKERGVGDVISDEMCYRFCKNADRIRLQRGDMLNYDDEIHKIIDLVKQLPTADEMDQNEEKTVDCSIWLLLLRAANRFYNEKGRYPGTNGVPCDIEAHDLKSRVQAIVKNVVLQNDDTKTEEILARVPDEAIAEMCRFGAAELHVVSSFIGGITSQEVIKLATNQYVPLDNTFVFDGHTQQSTTFKL